MAREVLDRPAYASNNSSKTAETDAKNELAHELISLSKPENPVLDENGEPIDDSSSKDALEFMATDPSTLGLIPVLLSQLHHEDPSLTQRSLRLSQRLMRFQNKSAAIVKSLSRVQILTRSKDKEFYGLTVQKSQQMLALASSELNAKKLEELVGIIDELADACADETDEGQANEVNQRMLCNMAVHDDVLSVVQRPIEADKTVGPKGRSAVLCACYGFLRAFVRNNPVNQHLVYEQMDFMLSQMLLYAKDGDVPRAITECLTEVYRDNIALCSLVSEQSLMPFITLLFEHRRDPVYLNLFRTVIKPRSTNIKANQNLVFRLLIARPDTKILVRGDVDNNKKGNEAEAEVELEKEDPSEESDDSDNESSEDKKDVKDNKGATLKPGDSTKGKEKESKEALRRAMTKAKSVGKGLPRLMERQSSKAKLEAEGSMGGSNKSTKGKSNVLEEYRLELISLLSLCAEERNFFTERNNQKLLSVDEAISCAVAVREKNPRMMAAYAYFIDEVYLNTESSSGSTSGSSVLLLQYSRGLWNMMATFYKEMQELVELIKESKTLRPDEDLTRTVYRIYVPFVQHFYSKAFVLRNATEDQQETSNKVLDIIYTLRQFANAREFREFRYNCTVAIKTMVAQGLVGTEHQKKIDKINKSQVSSVVNQDAESNTAATYKKRSEETSRFLRRVRSLINRAIAKEYLMEDISTLQEEESKKLDRVRSLEGDESFKDYVRILVSELARPPRVSSSALGDDERVFLEDVDLRLHALRLLREYIEFDGMVAKNITIPRRSRQQKLADLEAPVALVPLLSWKSPKLVQEVLSTLCSMLAAEATGTETHRGCAQVLTRYLTSHGSAAFFGALTGLLDDSKAVIRAFRRRYFASPSTAYYAQSVSLNANIPVAIDAGADLVQQLQVLVELPPDLGVLSCCRLLELLSSDRDSGALFRTLMVSESDQVDMVRELGLYVKTFEPSISGINSVLAEQLFATIASSVQGSLPNAQAAVNAQILHAANRLLLHVFEHSSSEGEDPELQAHLVALKGSIISFLLALTELGDERIISAIISQVSSKGFEETTRLLAPDSDPYNLVPPDDATVALASKAFRVIELLCDNDKEHVKSYRESLEVCDAHTRSRIGRIEILSPSNTLEKIYFPIPQDFRRQPKLKRQFFRTWSNVVAFQRSTDLDSLNSRAEAAMNKELERTLVNDDINWNRAGERLDGFVRWSEKVLLRREQAKASSQSYLAKRLILGWPIFWNLSFLIAIVFNLVLLFSDRNATSLLGASASELTLSVLGYVQIALSFLVLVSHFLRRAVYINAKAWLNRLGPDECHMLRPWPEIKAQKLKPLYKFEILYWIRSFFHVVFNPMSFFYICYFASAIIGASSPGLRYFFAFQLFQIVVRSQSLRGVLKALKMNASPLLLMLMLILDMQLVFAIIASVFFPNYFQPGLGAANKCDNLLQCLLTLLYFGLPTSGGLTQFLPSYFIDPWNGAIPSQSYAFVIFIFFYFSSTGPILLNVTFAIIVDTFGELRESRKEAKDKMGTTCFVCTLERDAFQQRAKDFNVHVEKEHNRLHYLYYFAYLKDITSRGLPKTDIEIVIMNRVFHRDFLKFFPVGRALALENESSETEFERELYNKVERLERTIEATSQQTEQLIKTTTESSRSELRALKADIASLRRALDPNARGSPSITPRSPRRADDSRTAAKSSRKEKTPKRERTLTADKK